MASVEHYEKYLGLPSFVGRNKKASFDNIKQQVWKKLQGREGKLFSQAGREILIKAVAQALPTYTMSCFKLPIGLCQTWRPLYTNSFGDRGKRIEKYIGLNGKNYASQKDGGLGFNWASRTSLNSMMPY